uniref:serine--tRNA ligase n=1 Tax=Chlamydomonas leiostraca TaxID=1034604 RepID=A0A7S0WN60_9CHLO
MAGAWVEGGDLPLKYAGVSPCFRREVGSHGRDTLGIFRVHQFDKVEQFGVTPPDPAMSAAMLADMLRNASDFYASLGIPHRLVRIVSGALNHSAACKVDLEAWFPASQTYRELVSGSNCTDYQARRLNIRMRAPTPPAPPGGAARGKAPSTPSSHHASGPGSSSGSARPGSGLPPSPFVHMLNCTLTATQRTLCAVMENHQTHEGFWVPAPLRPYLGGQDFVKFRRPLTASAGRLLLSALKHSRGGRG